MLLKLLLTLSLWHLRHFCGRVRRDDIVRDGGGGDGDGEPHSYLAAALLFLGRTRCSQSVPVPSWSTMPVRVCVSSSRLPLGHPMALIDQKAAQPPLLFAALPPARSTDVVIRLHLHSHRIASHLAGSALLDQSSPIPTSNVASASVSSSSRCRCHGAPDRSLVHEEPEQHEGRIHRQQACPAEHPVE